MSIKITAPAHKFRYKHYLFPYGSRYCTKKEVKDLSKMPIELGELKDRSGKIINKPPKKKPQKTSKKKPPKKKKK